MRAHKKPKGELVRARVFSFADQANEHAASYRSGRVGGYPKGSVTTRIYSRNVKADGETIGLSVVIVRKKLSKEAPAPKTIPEDFIPINRA